MNRTYRGPRQLANARGGGSKAQLANNVRNGALKVHRVEVEALNAALHQPATHLHRQRHAVRFHGLVVVLREKNREKQQLDGACE